MNCSWFDLHEKEVLVATPLLGFAPKFMPENIWIITVSTLSSLSFHADHQHAFFFKKHPFCFLSEGNFSLHLRHIRTNTRKEETERVEYLVEIYLFGLKTMPGSVFHF